MAFAKLTLDIIAREPATRIHMLTLVAEIMASIVALLLVMGLITRGTRLLWFRKLKRKQHKRAQSRQLTP